MKAFIHCSFNQPPTLKRSPLRLHVRTLLHVHPTPQVRVHPDSIGARVTLCTHAIHMAQH